MTDVSLLVTLHHEGALTRRSLVSLRDASVYAARFGISTELVAVLDRADAATQDALRAFDMDGFGSFRVIEVDHGSIGPSRNDGLAVTRGRMVAICDGDDLVSYNYVAELVREAEAGPSRALYFPEWLAAFGARHHVVRYHGLDRVTPLAFLQMHPYNSRAFARREVFLETPYSNLPPGNGYAHEDWDFNAACVAKGCDVRIARDTILFYRQRAGSVLSRAAALSTNQIPPNPLHEPSTFRRLGLDARRRSQAAPWSFGHLDHTARVADLERPVLRTLIRAANAIDPEVDIAALRGCDAFFGNVSDRAIAAGCAYLEMCERLGPGARFDEIFLLPFNVTGGADLYMADILLALRDVAPERRCLAILGEVPRQSDATRPMPDGVQVLDIGGEWPGLPMEDRLLVTLRLVENFGSSARLHLRTSPFATGFFRSWWPVLGGHETWLYRFSDAMIEDGGDLFQSGGGFAFVSEHAGRLARVVSDTERLVARDRERIGIWPERFACLPGRRAPETDAASVAAATAVTRRRVLWASRLDPEKRPELVPRIADRLARADPAIRIEMHGRAVLDAFDTALLAGKANLAWHGGYDGFAALDPAAHDVFVYTSWYDGVPNVVLEAIAAGLPVIAPDVGGIGEIVEDGLSGILLPSLADDDAAAEAYAEAILRLVGDPELRRRLATEALARLAQRHAPAAHAARVAALFARKEDPHDHRTAASRAWRHGL